MTEVIWTEKYRPKTVNECILPDRLKNKFLSFVENDSIDNNLLLSGSPGMGKTTIALATINELESEYFFVNASTHGNIDMLRGQVSQFVSVMSFNGKRKYVIFDEAERLTPQTQDGIRGFIEEYSHVCGFIFTCNNPSKISDAIKSRCAHIEFTFNQSEEYDLVKQYAKRIVKILKSENIKFDTSEIGRFIIHNKKSLDFRNLLVQIQFASKNGEIKAEDLKDKSEEHFQELVDYIKNKQFDKFRRWIYDHSEYSSQDVFRKFYDGSKEYVKDKPSQAILITLIGKYQYQAAFAVDQEINLASFFVEVMMDVEFK